MTTLNPARTGLTHYTLGLPVVLVLLLATTQVDFRSTQNLMNFSGQIGALLIVAVGQLFVTLVAGIDLSVGSVMSLASAFAATQSDPLAAVAMATALGVAVGTVNGMGVAFAGVHPLVMTLSTATFLQGLAYVVLYAGVARLSAGRVAVLQFVYPACAVGVEWAVYDRALTPSQLAGVLMMLTALVVVGTQRARQTA